MLYQLSYGPLPSYSLFITTFSSGQGRNRTTDTVIFSHVLYQLSYLAKKIRPGLAASDGLAKGAPSDYARGALQPTAFFILDRVPTVTHLPAQLASVSNIAFSKHQFY